MTLPDSRKPGSVRHIILVGSGKGGVGKTTVSVNLALALSRRGRRVGVLDADLYGPNVPLLLGIHRTSDARFFESYVPIMLGSKRPEKPPIPSVDRFGLRVMSAGFLVSERQAVQIGSNLMVGKLTEALLFFTDWADCDTIIVDLPPGADEPMATLVKSADVTGGIIVTTPQDIARLDAQREIKRCASIGLPLLGIVENMSYLVCEHCGHRQEVFQRGTRYADLGAKVLAEIPLDPRASAQANAGVPLMASDATGVAVAAFEELGKVVEKMLAG